MSPDTPIRVLLLEDDAHEAWQVADLLHQHGDVAFEVTHAVELRGALTLLQQHSFDLVIVDLALPDSQGVDTLRALREPAGAIPIVVLTELYEEPMAAKAVQHGAHDYVFKGFLNEIALADVLRRIVANHRGENSDDPDENQADGDCDDEETRTFPPQS